MGVLHFKDLAAIAVVLAFEEYQNSIAKNLRVMGCPCTYTVHAIDEPNDCPFNPMNNTCLYYEPIQIRDIMQNERNNFSMFCLNCQGLRAHWDAFIYIYIVFQGVPGRRPFWSSDTSRHIIIALWMATLKFCECYMSWNKLLFDLIWL